jgi:hypothetical protein
MFKLPFHADSPLAAGLVGLGLSLITALLLWAHGRDTIVGKAQRWFFARRFAHLGPEKAQKLGRVFLVSLIVVFAAVAVFGITVGTGVVENGEPPRPLTMDEFLKQQRK